MRKVLVTKLGVVLFSTRQRLSTAGWELSGGRFRKKNLAPIDWEVVGVDGGPIAFVAPDEQPIVEGETYVVHFDGEEHEVKAESEKEWYAALDEAKAAAAKGRTEKPVEPEHEVIEPGPGGDGNGRGRRDETLERLFSIPFPTRSFDSASEESPLRTRVRRMIQLEAGPIGEFATAAQWQRALAQHTEEHERAGVRLLRWVTRAGYDETAGERPLGVYAGHFSMVEQCVAVAAPIAETIEPFSDVVDLPSVDAARHVLLARLRRLPNELAREQVSTLKLAGEARALLDALDEFAIVLGYRNREMNVLDEDIVGTGDLQMLDQYRVLDFWVRSICDILDGLVDQPPGVEFGAAKVRLLAYLDGASTAARRLNEVWSRVMDFGGADQERELIEIDGREITVHRWIDWVDTGTYALKADIEAAGRFAIRSAIPLLELQVAASDTVCARARDRDAPPALAHPIVLGHIEAVNTQLTRALEAAREAVPGERLRHGAIDRDRRQDAPDPKQAV